ncbi:hypothetical protein [Flammeovirga aprica]|uniref:Uncharacterized protein n=1 Tax=Flammeovirga aprica JL-4 TaxID=694437 RepID=A0A7X9P2D1_9BACT|nr:hypothetical protein [Flammeovirga aprica]NME68271.1 hypothetical protein [Flammeovirga aprica JL-4]
MKKFYYSIITLISSIVIFYACQDPLENIFIPISPELSSYEVSIQVYDLENPSNLSDPEALTVELLGPDADKILNNSGRSEFIAQNGIINLAVNKKYSDITEPIRFTVKISGEDYLTTTIPVEVTGEEKFLEINANIVNLSSPPTGVDIEREFFTINSDGSTGEEIVVSTANADTQRNLEVSTEVVIPAGVQFFNASGELISGRELEVQVINFDNNETESLEAFPGGFSPNSIIDENGLEVTDATFITAGFTSIDMFLSGEEVKKFSKPINIVMNINKGTFNPETRENLKVGDIIPIWSYSNDDGQWVYHGDGPVTLSNTGGFKVEYTTTHLSSYNLDFKSTGKCSSTRSVVRLEGVENLPDNVNYNMKLSFVQENSKQPVSSFATKGWSINNKSKDLTLRNAPNVSMQMLIYIQKPGKTSIPLPNLPEDDTQYSFESETANVGEFVEVYRSEAFNGCDGEISVPIYDIIQSAGITPQINVTIEYVGRCGTREIAPSVGLYKKNASEIYEYAGYVNKGRITLSLPKIDSTYYFGFYWGTEFYEDSLYVNSTQMLDTDINLEEFCEKVLEDF